MWSEVQSFSQSARVSVVTAVYNAARYLPDLFESLSEQTLDHQLIELIMVNDGSTDDSLSLLKAFADQWDGPAVVLTQENAGQSAARNAGLDVATGDWVSFVDADDYVSPNFYAALLESAQRHPEAGAHASKPLTWNEEADTIRDAHPLNFRFTSEDRVVDLDAVPRFAHPHVTTTIFRRSQIESVNLRFDERIHIRFEDGKFVTQYLLSCDHPLLAFVSSTNYYIRIRADGSSTIQSARFDSRVYTDVPRWGHLEVFSFALERRERIPEWAQILVLYDIFWLMKSSQAEPLRSRVFDEEVHTTFRSLLSEVMSHISVSTVLAFDLIPLASWMPLALILYKPGMPSFATPVTGNIDRERGLVAIRYVYRGERPTERLSVAGAAADARYVKDQQLEFIGRPLVWERTLWVSTEGPVQLWLDEELQDLSRVWTKDHKPRYRYPWRRRAGARRRGKRYDPMRIDELRGGRAANPGLLRRLRTWLRTTATRLRRVSRGRRWQDRLLRSAIRIPLIRNRYDGAWVFMDRDTNANDSAEVLFRWMVQHHPEIKSFFVLRKESPDWSRLADTGARLMPYGSWQWKALMLLAENVVSSHADRYVVAPLPAKRYGMPRWRFIFLQHGIIKGDISGWLNAKSIDLFVTSTEDEYSYVSGPGPFKFSPREVRLTGLPRHDDLLRRDQEVRQEDRSFIIVAPTWRGYLSAPSRRDSAVRELNPEFMQSRFAQEFSGLLASPELGSILTEAGLQVAFMPHPNLEAYLPQFELPDYVKVMRYADYDVKWVIARSVAMITDYSSIAFNMAYVQRPVVYFQFDRDDFYSGGHTERPGYFDYESHGFGPVAETRDQVLDAVSQVINGSLPDTYQERMARTFPVRDGNNSARVFEAITQLSQELPFPIATQRAEPDSWSS